MIIVVAAVLVVLSVPLTGASLAPLARLTVRRSWVVWASIALQLLITSVPEFPATLGQVLHIVSFAFAGIFLWSNRHLPGEWLITLGAALNLIAIAANGGTMPATAWAWRTAGFATPTDSFGNSSLAQSARVPWLGDVFAVPANWPLSNVFSIGDVVIVLGLTYLVHRSCRRPIRTGLAALPSSARATLATLHELVQCQQRVTGLIDELSDWICEDAVVLNRLKVSTADASPLSALLASQSLLSPIEQTRPSTSRRWTDSLIESVIGDAEPDLSGADADRSRQPALTH